MLCNEVPRRVKYIDNLGRYTTKNFVIYTVYLFKQHYFVCPQSLVASHWLFTLYITPTHWLVLMLLIRETVSSLQFTRQHCVYFCTMNTFAIRIGTTNSNESTSTCHFHIAKQFTNAGEGFGAAGFNLDRKKMCRTRVPRVLNHSTRQRWGVSFTTQLLYPQGNWPLCICWVGSWVEVRAGQRALGKQNVSFHCWESHNDYLEACIIVTMPTVVSRLVTNRPRRPVRFAAHRQPLCWNFMYHSRIVLSVGGSVWYMIWNLRCTVTIDSVLANSKTHNAFLFTVNAIFLHD